MYIFKYNETPAASAHRRLSPNVKAKIPEIHMKFNRVVVVTCVATNSVMICSRETDGSVMCYCAEETSLSFC